MIKDGDKIVKDFHTGQMVKRESKADRFSKCVGCSLATTIICLAGTSVLSVIQTI